MTRCDHSGLHSGIGRYSHSFKAIRFVVVCDRCGAECREVQIEATSPGSWPTRRRTARA